MKAQQLLPLLALAFAGVAQMFIFRREPFIPWEKEYIYGFERNTTRLPQQEDITETDYTRTTHKIPAPGDTGDMLEAWVYEPVAQDPMTPPPCVIMSHGLGSQKDMGLHAYAEQFVQAGMVVVVFDYRGFGGSDGWPRHWVSWKREIEDIQTVIDYVAAGKLLPAGRLDTNRIGLWGVSYSGGQMLILAARKSNWPKVRVVIANEPYISGAGNIKKAYEQKGLSGVVRLLLAAILDKFREFVNAPPIYIKLIAPDGELAILNVSPEELLASRSGQKNPPARIGGWKNAIAARMLVDNLSYKPLKHIPNIRCPVLLVVGTKDDLTPATHVYKAKEILGDRAELLEKPYGHIEMHKKMVAPEELAPVIDFLRKHLGLKPVHVTTQPHEPQQILEQQASEAF